MSPVAPHFTPTTHCEPDASSAPDPSPRPDPHSHAGLRRVLQHRFLRHDPTHQGLQQVGHRIKTQGAKMVANLFPEVALGPRLLPRRLEQRTAQLLNLI